MEEFAVLVPSNAMVMRLRPRFLSDIQGAERLICDREQCRYEGPPGASGEAVSERERRTNAACGTGCAAWLFGFPLAAVLVGLVSSVVIGVPAGWAVVLGLAAGVGSVVAVYRWFYRISPTHTPLPGLPPGESARLGFGAGQGPT